MMYYVRQYFIEFSNIFKCYQKHRQQQHKTKQVGLDKNLKSFYIKNTVPTELKGSS